MSKTVRMVLDDPEMFHLLTADTKEMLIQGAIATVNMQAALTRKNAIKNIEGNFTLRNNFTTRQVQFDSMEKSRFISLSQVKSIVGITEMAEYMVRQETGGAHKVKEGGKALAIAGLHARGGSSGSLVQKKYRLSNLRKLEGESKPEGHTFRSWLVSKAAAAYENNLLMYYNNRLWEVTSFQKKSDAGVEFKKEEVYSFVQHDTQTAQTPWFIPATEKPAKDVESIYISQMKKLGM